MSSPQFPGAAASIQQQLPPHAGCFGCGSENAQGLHLRSYPGEGGVEAVFSGLAHHGNGMGYLNGGIISTVLDCDSAAAAMYEAQQRGWFSEQDLPRYVTAALDVRFLRPAPVEQPLQVLATVSDARPDQMLGSAEIRFDDKQRATATARFVRWRPRPIRRPPVEPLPFVEATGA